MFLTESRKHEPEATNENVPCVKPRPQRTQHTQLAKALNICNYGNSVALK